MLKRVFMTEDVKIVTYKIHNTALNYFEKPVTFLRILMYIQRNEFSQSIVLPFHTITLEINT